MEPENIKMKLLFALFVLCYIFNGSENPYVTQTIQCVLWWLQHIGQILIYSYSVIRHLIKKNGDEQIRLQIRRNL
jgi:hypothetical protein